MVLIWDVALFESVSATNVVLLFLVYFFAFAVKGAFGLGSLTPTVLFGAWVVEPHHAVLLALVSNAYTQIQFIPDGVRHGDWGLVRRVVPANFAAAALGVWIFGRLDGPVLTLVLGLALGAIIVTDLTRALPALAEQTNLRSPVVVVSLSALAGLTSGVTGAGGLIFLALYLKLACPEPRSFRATIILLAALMVAWRVAVLAMSGFVTPTLLLECAVLLPITLLGGWVGIRLFRWLPREYFYTGLQLVLIAAAVNLVWKGLRDVL